MPAWLRGAIKVSLVGGAVVSLFSYGGLLIFTFPLLVVGMWWAVRHSGLVERSAWIALATLAAGWWAWEVTYVVHEGETPSSLVIAVIAGTVMASLLAAVAPHYSFRRADASRHTPSG